MNIAKGQRFPLKPLCQDNVFQIGLQISGTKSEVDFACFGLNEQQKLYADAYMVFFNQPKTPCGALELATPSGDSCGFLCRLNNLPPTIHRLVFTAAIDGVETMRQIQTGYVRFLVANQEVARFAFSGADFQDEKALMLGELYRKDGEWRFGAIGQGFNGGLSALVEHFGGEVAKHTTTPTSTASSSTTNATKLNLSKVTLEKRGDKISLEKPRGASGYGRIVCNLNWTANHQKKGLFGGTANSRIDLDLGCLYELNNGDKHVVQALGNCFGAYETSPYIHLAGDDRTGSSVDGEFLYINGNHLSHIRRICIFAFIYEGIVNWTEADAVVTVPEQPIIEVRLDAQQKQLAMCAIAMIENHHGELKVTKLAEYFRGHKELDKHYKWGMRWTTGSK